MNDVHTDTFEKLDLSPELREVKGLVETDLRAVVSMLTAQADARLMLTRREIRQLQRNLWNGMVQTINRVVEPLSAEAR